MSKDFIELDRRNRKKIKRAFTKLFRKALKDYQDTGVRDLSDMMRRTMKKLITDLRDAAIENNRSQFETEEDLHLAREALTNYLNGLLGKEIEKLLKQETVNKSV